MRRVLLALGAICAVTASGLTATPAVAFCSEPHAPFCANSFGPFRDSGDYNSCHGQVESYRVQVQIYVDCLDRDRRTALDEYNRVVDAFNRKVR